jgi:hypothetical protein
VTGPNKPVETSAGTDSPNQRAKQSGSSKSVTELSQNASDYHENSQRNEQLGEWSIFHIVRTA